MLARNSLFIRKGKRSMKKWLGFVIWTFLFFLGITCVFANAETAIQAASSETAAGTYLAGNPEDVAVVILHTNDVHVAFDDNIGYDGLALYKKELEDQYDHVLLIDAGDAIQGRPIGAISKGAEIIRMMNRLGYDLAVPGNTSSISGLKRWTHAPKHWTAAIPAPISASQAVSRCLRRGEFWRPVI